MEEYILYKESTASLDVDSQKGFTPLCPNELPVPEGDEIVDEQNTQAKKAKYRLGSKDAHHRKAIWVATANEPQLTPIVGTNVDVRWNSHCNIGEYGFELLDGLPPVSEYDFFVYKGIELDMHPYSACYHDLAKTKSTGLIEWLLQHDISDVIVGGLATNYCVFETVVDLVNAGFQVILNLGACRGLGDINPSIEKMKAMGVIIVNNASEIVVHD
jgi:nicotinamidase/pyrazinamidase